MSPKRSRSKSVKAQLEIYIEKGDTYRPFQSIERIKAIDKKKKSDVDPRLQIPGVHHTYLGVWDAAKPLSCSDAQASASPQCAFFQLEDFGHQATVEQHPIDFDLDVSVTGKQNTSGELLFHAPPSSDDMQTPTLRSTTDISFPSIIKEEDASSFYFINEAYSDFNYATQQLLDDSAITPTYKYEVAGDSRDSRLVFNNSYYAYPPLQAANSTSFMHPSPSSGGFSMGDVMFSADCSQAQYYHALPSYLAMASPPMSPTSSTASFYDYESPYPLLSSPASPSNIYDYGDIHDESPIDFGFNNTFDMQLTHYDDSTNASEFGWSEEHQYSSGFLTPM